jgi:rare lipoprotein A
MRRRLKPTEGSLRLLAVPVLAALIGLAPPLLPQASAAMVSGSYYHSKFVGRPMACGGRYSHEAYTAASNHHPCNTRLLVRRGNRSVMVRVTDRCGRCGIDLSEAAARDLGMKQVGRASVHVTVLD